MSDGLSEAYRGTYFSDRSKLPRNYTVPKEEKIKWWRKIMNNLKRK